MAAPMFQKALDELRARKGELLESGLGAQLLLMVEGGADPQSLVLFEVVDQERKPDGTVTLHTTYSWGFKQ